MLEKGSGIGGVGVGVVGSVMAINIEWQDQHGKWQHYQSEQNQADAYRVAQRRAESTKKRHRLVDDDGRLLDLLDH